MSEISNAWAEVAERCESLGLKLKMHVRQARDEFDEDRDGALREALDRLAEAIEDTAEAAGAAAKDPAIREDLRDVGQALSSALGTTFAEAGEQLRSAFDRGRPGR